MSQNPPYVDIIAQVAAERRLTRADLTGPSKLRYICEARWEAMRRLRERGVSKSTIGRLLNRDHTTVIYGLRKAA